MGGETGTIRAATAADADAIAELSALLGYPTDADSLAARLLALPAGENAVLVVEQEGAVVGWVHAFRSCRLEEDPFAELGGLIVAPGCRGHGFGRRLMGAAEGWARQRGCSLFRIRSHAKRAAAHRFYERVGYRRVKRQQVLDKDLGGTAR